MIEEQKPKQRKYTEDEVVKLMTAYGDLAEKMGLMHHLPDANDRGRYTEEARKSLARLMKSISKGL